MTDLQDDPTGPRPKIYASLRHRTEHWPAAVVLPLSVASPQHKNPSPNTYLGDHAWWPGAAPDSRPRWARHYHNGRSAKSGWPSAGESLASSPHARQEQGSGDHSGAWVHRQSTSHLPEKAHDATAKTLADGENRSLLRHRTEISSGRAACQP